MAQATSGMDFLLRLETAGVVQHPVRRVVIDAAVDAPVVIYVERYGDERLLSVDLGPLKDGVCVTVEDKKADAP